MKLKDYLILLKHATNIVILDSHVTEVNPHLQDYFPELKTPIKWVGKRQNLLYPKDGCYVFAEEGFDDYEVLAVGVTNGLNNDPHIVINVISPSRYPEFKDDPS